MCCFKTAYSESWADLHFRRKFYAVLAAEQLLLILAVGQVKAEFQQDECSSSLCERNRGQLPIMNIKFKINGNCPYFPIQRIECMNATNRGSRYAIASLLLVIFPWMTCLLVEISIDPLKHSIGYENSMLLSHLVLLFLIISFILSVAFAITAIIQGKKRFGNAKMAWISLFINLLLIFLILISSIFFE